MLLEHFFTLSRVLSIDCTLLLAQFLVHLDLALLHVLGLLVARRLITIQLHLVDSLLVLKLESLLYLLLHILEDDLTMKLSLPHFVLGVDL